jgi:phenylacetate-CoA ligase
VVIVTNKTEWLAELVRHAYAAAPAIRVLLDTAGVHPEDVRQPRDLRALPITRKDDLVERQRLDPPFGGFLGAPPRRIFVSPGPLFDPQGVGPDYWRFAQALRAAGFTDRDIVLNASAYHMTPMGLMLDSAAQALGCTVIPSGVGNAELQVTAAHQLQASAYCGTPSFLQILLDRADTLQLELSIQRAFVAGETLPPSLRQNVGRHGIRVRQGYGTADLGCLGFECDELNGFHVAQGAIVEIVDPRTGDPLPDHTPGEVVATVNSPTYPLLRFGTGDLSALDSTPCACGRTSPRLLGIQGRVGEAVKVRGMFVHPRQLATLMNRFPTVTGYRAIVDRVDDHDTFVLEVAAPAIPEGLEETLREVLHVRPEVALTESLNGESGRLVDRR